MSRNILDGYGSASGTQIIWLLYKSRGIDYTDNNAKLILENLKLQPLSSFH